MSCTVTGINLNELFYHVAPIILEPNSIIKKGNWGRILVNHDKFNNNTWIMLSTEHAHENTRKLKHINKPSRFNCTFVCQSLDAVKQYQLNNSPLGLIYEVEVIDKMCSFHVGDYEKSRLPLVYMNNNYSEPLILDSNGVATQLSFNWFNALADQYWNIDQSTFSNTTEILLDSDIRIIRQVN